MAKNSPKCAFRHVARMVGDGGVAAVSFIVPDFVASGGLAIENKSKGFYAFGDLALVESG